MSVAAAVSRPRDFLSTASSCKTEGAAQGGQAGQGKPSQLDGIGEQPLLVPACPWQTEGQERLLDLGAEPLRRQQAVEVLEVCGAHEQGSIGQRHMVEGGEECGGVAERHGSNQWCRGKLLLEGGAKSNEILLPRLGRVHQEKGEVRSAKQVLAPLQRLRHVSGQRGTDIGFQPEMTTGGS